MKNSLLLLANLLALTATSRAELVLPAIIGDHLVLQQQQADPIWGWDTPGTPVTVSFAGQTKTATADPSGKWTVKLDPMPANATPQAMTIKGSSERTLQDLLIGEVWMCSGQSNMEYPLSGDWNGDLEALGATLPTIRLITVPMVGTQEPQTHFKGQWTACTPESCREFSAVGFFFGRHLQRALGVPIGLIDNSWGGSTAEAWVRRASLEQDPRFKPLMDRTVQQETALTSEQAKANQQAAIAKWEAATAQAKAEHQPLPNPPRNPNGWLTANSRPGNIFNGMVHPTLGYGIKGVIWYQGESNASRAWEYAQLFPFMIQQWRAEWKQGDFPFYWVQLADYMAERTAPGDSAWAELREAQTKTQSLPNTGQAVIIDLGEGKDIHPKNKHDVAARLVRLALAKDYGIPLPCRSPEFKNVAFAGTKATVTLDLFGRELRPFDVPDAIGFALCGADRVWHYAKGRVIGKDQVEVSSDLVPAPVAVRYAWADNPVCNLFTKDGLPVTPFRSDDFALSTQPQP
ncbi:MAG: hypothetical protein RLZZ522_1496 [Verrucomicrobiota bacterium]